MPDDVDLRSVHRHHEPDPAFRAGLRARLAEEWLEHADSEHHPIHQEDITVIDLQSPHTTRRGRRWYPIIGVVAAAAAVIAVLAVTTGDDGDQDVGVVDRPDESTIAEGTVVFTDDFDDDRGQWTPDADVEIVDGEFRWRITPAGQNVQLRSGQAPDLTDMRVGVAVAGTDPDSRIGLRCRQGPGENSWLYYLRLDPTTAVIGVVPPESAGTPSEVLAEKPYVRPESPFEVSATCVDVGGVTELALEVDGEPVLSATYDDPIPDGTGTIDVQAGPEGSSASDVAFDRFEIIDLG